MIFSYMETNKRKRGRNPKADPARHRYVFYLNDVDNACFLSLFEQSNEKVKAHFVTSCIFNKPIQVVQLDKGTQDYYMRLTTFFGQFRAIGINYNQVVKALHTNFGEKKALAFLYKLEQATKDLVEFQKKIVELSEDFKQKLGF